MDDENCGNAFHARSTRHALLCSSGVRTSNRCLLASLVARTSLAVTLVCATGTALAGSGFLLRSHSATTLGSAQAGMTAAAEDVTSIVLNPATLGFGTGREFAAAVTTIVSRGGFEPIGATTVLGTRIPGGDGGDPSRTGVIPNLYYATDLAERTRFGLALTSFHGLGFRWDEGWVGRYHAGRSELATLDVVPSVSFKPNDSLTLGVAVDLRYARAKTTTAIDLGTADVVATGGLFGGIPANDDGTLHTKLDDWGVGYAMGVVLEPRRGSRIAVSYRSRIRMDLEGPATFDPGGPVGQVLAGVTGAFSDTTGHAPLTLPAAVSAGFSQSLGAKWSIVGDVQWTQWSDLERLDLTFGNVAQPGIQTELNWRDSWFVALGLRHEFDERWTFRGGVAYDQTPSRPATSTPAIPDANSTWVGVGLSYRFSPTAKLDLAYGHIFVRDNDIALQASAPGNALRGTLLGTIRGSSVDYLAVQWVGSF